MIKWRWLHEHQHDRTHFAAMLQRAALPGILATLYMSITMPMDMPPHIHVRTCGAWPYRAD
jgi:hypothetical protein